MPDIAAGAMLEAVRSNPIGATLPIAGGTRTNAAMRWLAQRQAPLAKLLKISASDDPAKGVARFDWMKFDVRDAS